MTKSGKWLETKFLKWQLEVGGRRSITEFAEFLGSSQSYISMIISGKRIKPGLETATRWCIRLNDYELLDMLGYPRPDHQLREIRGIYEAAPPKKRKELAFVVRAWALQEGIPIISIDEEGHFIERKDLPEDDQE